MPPETIEWLLDGYALSTEYPQQPLPTVADLIGHPPHTFARWAIDHVDVFR